MKLNTVTLLGAATFGLVACGGTKEPTPASNEGAAATANTAGSAPTITAKPGQTFANKAAASDAYEIATSQLALEKSKSNSVKQFANHMIKAHTESTAKLKAAAAAAAPAMTPDPTLSAEQQAKLESLRASSSEAFDATFIAEQQAAHDMTLAALRDYAANGDIAPLKAFASETVPVVAAHVNMAKSLKP